MRPGEVDLEERSDENVSLSKASKSFDLDGDGKVSPWEANMCRICLISALVLAFGKEALAFL